jgi:hypothetical protein
VSAVALCGLFILQAKAVGNRYAPPAENGSSQIVVVRTQKDVYGICRERSIRGAAVVSLGKHFNIQYWAPEHLAKSTPFPIRTHDVRAEYERALDSHNWLFIANRTGMVRTVWTVLSPDEFRRRQQDLSSDYGLALRRNGYSGFHYDLPRGVTTLDKLPPQPGPVVVVVDAGYFSPDVNPAATARELKQRLPYIAFLIVVSSLDEGELSWEMRRNLSAFIRVWQETT